MKAYLGFDTSNYTTSVALYFPESNTIVQRKKILQVKSGNRGLRQSEAVFQHTVNLPELMQDLYKEVGKVDLQAVCASVQPRLEKDSYMPCFLVGKSVASGCALSSHVPLYISSHQHGHILASLFCTDKMEFIDREFLAFHLSGGTTEVLYVKPDKDEILRCELFSGSSDVKAGQIIDRTGVLLGLNFPCGPELEKLSQKSNKEFKIKVSIVNNQCSLSGIENKVKKMISDSFEACDVAKFAIDSVIANVVKLSEIATTEYGSKPIVFAGGVASNAKLQNILRNKFDSYFATPQFSADNATGMALMAYLKHKNDNFNCNPN